MITDALARVIGWMQLDDLGYDHDTERAMNIPLGHLALDKYGF